jgi:hypothetical protein
MPDYTPDDFPRLLALAFPAAEGQATINGRVFTVRLLWSPPQQVRLDILHINASTTGDLLMTGTCIARAGWRPQRAMPARRQRQRHRFMRAWRLVHLA